MKLSMLCLLVLLVVISTAFCIPAYFSEQDFVYDIEMNSTANLTGTEINSTTVSTAFATEGRKYVSTPMPSLMIDPTPPETTGDSNHSMHSNHGEVSKDDGDVPPQIIILRDDAGVLKIKSSSGAHVADEDVKWLVVSKRTHLDRVEDLSKDERTGKIRRVLSEDRYEQLHVFRDNRYEEISNDFDLTDAFQV